MAKTRGADAPRNFSAHRLVERAEASQAVHPERLRERAPVPCTSSEFR